MISLNSHSRPILLKNIGDLGTFPLIKSNDPPTPMTTFAENLGRLLLIQISCFGEPNATKSMSTFLSFRPSNHSLETIPTLNPGYFFLKHSEVLSATLGPAPRKPTVI